MQTTHRAAALLTCFLVAGCGGDDDGTSPDGSVSTRDGGAGRDGGGTPDRDGSAGSDGGGSRTDGGGPPPGDIGTCPPSAGACPAGATQVEISDVDDLEAAARGEGAFADDPPDVCYFVHDGTYASSSNVLLWIMSGGDAGAPRRFVGQSRDGVVINARSTIEAQHVVVENMTFDLTGYEHSGSFNTI